MIIARISRLNCTKAYLNLFADIRIIRSFAFTSKTIKGCNNETLDLQPYITPESQTSTSITLPKQSESKSIESKRFKSKISTEVSNHAFDLSKCCRGVKIYSELYGDAYVDYSFVFETGDPKLDKEFYGYELGKALQQFRYLLRSSIVKNSILNNEANFESLKLLEESKFVFMKRQQDIALLVKTIEVFLSKYGSNDIQQTFVVPSGDYAWPRGLNQKNIHKYDKLYYFDAICVLTGHWGYKLGRSITNILNRKPRVTYATVMQILKLTTPRTRGPKERQR